MPHAGDEPAFFSSFFSSFFHQPTPYFYRACFKRIESKKRKSARPKRHMLICIDLTRNDSIIGRAVVCHKDNDDLEKVDLVTQRQLGMLEQDLLEE